MSPWNARASQCTDHSCLCRQAVLSAHWLQAWNPASKSPSLAKTLVIILASCMLAQNSTHFLSQCLPKLCQVGLSWSLKIQCSVQKFQKHPLANSEAYISLIARTFLTSLSTLYTYCRLLDSNFALMHTHSFAEKRKAFCLRSHSTLLTSCEEFADMSHGLNQHGRSGSFMTLVGLFRL